MLSARNRLQNNSSINKINFSHKNTEIIAKQLGMTSFELKDRLNKHRNDVMKIYQKYMIDT